MKKTALIASAAALSMATVVSFSSTASALGPLDIEIGAKAGVGTTPSNLPSGSINPLGFGIGGRAGVSILGLYGGGSIIYYLGGSQSEPGGSVSVHTLMYGFEIGYGMKLIEILTLRAQVGIGSYDMSGSGSTAFGSGSSDIKDLYIEPGLTALVSLPFVGWFVGADANVLALTGMPDPNNLGGKTTDIGFTLHGQVGYKF
jgi:hypothetical protein